MQAKETRELTETEFCLGTMLTGGIPTVKFVDASTQFQDDFTRDGIHISASFRVNNLVILYFSLFLPPQFHAIHSP